MNAVVVACLPGDGYIGKFCCEAIIASSGAELIQEIHPFSLPAQVSVGQGKLGLHPLEIYAGQAPHEDLLIVTTDFKVSEAEVALNACLLLAQHLQQADPREILIFDGFTPAGDFEGNAICQMLVEDPPTEFWNEASLPPFYRPIDKDKYFLFLAAALKMVGLPARAVICETSGADVDPDGAKLLLGKVQGHPAMPPEFSLAKIDEKAEEIRRELETLMQEENEKTRTTQAAEQARKDESDLSYIQ
jgi:proteasome assembly chaperone (PAC2) family protein